VKKRIKVAGDKVLVTKLDLRSSDEGKGMAIPYGHAKGHMVEEGLCVSLCIMIPRDDDEEEEGDIADRIILRTYFTAACLSSIVNALQRYTLDHNNSIWK